MPDEKMVHDALQSIAIAVSLGTFLIIVARRMGLPSIVILLAAGVALGPEIGFGLIKADALGQGLGIVIAFAIGLILFEGGLTLDIAGYRQAPAMIRRLLTFGVIITWMATTVLLVYLLGLGWKISLIGASLVIVTGPTVIAPLLKRIRATSKVHNILHWEGVLIDPIGVFIAVLCFEWFVGTGGGQAALGKLLLRIGIGLGAGFFCGYAGLFVLRKRWIPDDLINGFTISIAVLAFGIAESVASEAGLLSVTLAGFTIGAGRPPQVRQMRRFKGEIADLMIGMIFLLLASRLSLDQFREFGWAGFAVVAGVIFIVRPLNIFLCSVGLDMNWREKVFLSWIGPRGIVAASLASLFAIELKNSSAISSQGVDPRIVETFAYSVIVLTITLQGSTAGIMASLLKLRRPAPTGWAIVGAHALGRRVARFIARNTSASVILIDTNKKAIAQAIDEDLRAIQADARETSLAERQEWQEIGNLIALTDNVDLNALLNERWAESLGRAHVFRWDTGAAHDASNEEIPGQIIWSRLPKPSLLSAEMRKGDCSFLERAGLPGAEEENTHPNHVRIPLVGLQGSRFMLDPPGGPAVTFPAPKSGGGEVTLYVDRRTDSIARAVVPELVMRVEAETIDDLFPRIIERMVEVSPTLPRDETIAELLEREHAFPTSLGEGVAVPHAYGKGIEQRYCAIVQVPDGMMFAPSDREAVRLVFLLISPTGDPEGHLQALADIARLVSNETVRAQLMSETDADEIVNIVRTHTGSL